MVIREFDEDLRHRHIVSYSPIYAEVFSLLKAFVESSLNHVQLIHIGSTAVPGLRGKPMIDAAAVTAAPDLRTVQNEFGLLGFHSREVRTDHDDKPYTCGSVEFEDGNYNVNIHICRENDPVHTDALAFIEKLKNDAQLRSEYESVKDSAHRKDPVNPEIYNSYKDEFISSIYESIKHNS